MTVTLDQAKARKGYDYRLAEKLLSAHEQSGFWDRVTFFHRGDGARKPKPGPGEIHYVKATGGKWGQSSVTDFSEQPCVTYSVIERLVS